MKIWKVMIIFLSILAISTPALGTSVDGDQITVTGADTLRQEGVSVDPGLVDSADDVATRVIIQYANTLRQMILPSLPTQLQTLIAQVTERVIVQFANTTRLEELPPLPGPLDTLLGYVPDRVVIQFANTNRDIVLDYPGEVVKDDTPPQLIEFTEVMSGTQTAVVSWLTDEFADSLVMYGTKSGSYTHTESDPLYVKEHAVVLPDIVEGTTYYYKAQSTDLSGNTTTSQEQSFTATLTLFVYLPMTHK